MCSSFQQANTKNRDKLTKHTHIYVYLQVNVNLVNSGRLTEVFAFEATSVAVQARTETFV